MDRLDVDGILLEVAQIDAPVATAATPRAPIVFLHEGLGSVAMWRNWPAAVCHASARAGVLYSRRGYGRSEDVPGVREARSATGAGGGLAPDYLHREAWSVLPALLARLGVQRPVLLGHSDGASIALLYASRFPVAACIVLAPHVMVEEISIESIAQARTAFEGGDLRRRLSRYHAHVDTAFWQWNDVWLSSGFRDFDIRADCRSITGPVLAIQGADDPYGTLAQIEQIDLPQTQLTRVALAHCGHSPQRDHPEQTVRLVRDFLAAQD